MSAYVLLTRDDKSGTISPTIIGPFDTHEDAATFIDPDTKAGEYIDRMESAYLDTYGGYAAVVIVSEDTAENPDEYAKHAVWYFDGDYKPLVKAIADNAADILTSLDYAKQAIRNGGDDWEGKQRSIAQLESAQQAVRGCRDAIKSNKVSPSKPARGLSSRRIA